MGKLFAVNQRADRQAAEGVGKIAVRAEVEARQSWVVNAARLGVAAPWIILVLLSTRPEAALAYNTPAGSAVIAGGLVLSLLAYRIMIALGRLPEERRERILDAAEIF